jgi:Protein of unknown function (DUF1572)
MEIFLNAFYPITTNLLFIPLPKADTMTPDTATSFLDTAVKRLKYYKSLAEKTFSQLSDKELHYSPGPESNSIAVIVQHMAGNMLSRWTDFLTTDGEKTWRQRDAEFESQPLKRDELIALWENGWDCFFGALTALSPQDLVRTVTIRGEGLLVVDAINRQLAHYPYHIGQIVFLGRMIRGPQWQNLSIPKGESQAYNQAPGIKDPAKNH